MKTIILSILIAVLFSACDEVAVNKTQTEPVQNKIIYYNVDVLYNNGQEFHYEASKVEYGMVLDNSGFGFTILKDSVFLASHLSENIQSVFINVKAN